MTNGSVAAENSSKCCLRMPTEKLTHQVPLHATIRIARQRAEQSCKSAGIEGRHLRVGNRRRVSSVRSCLALELTGELGLYLAETAGQLGVSTSATGKILKKKR